PSPSPCLKGRGKLEAIGARLAARLSPGDRITIVLDRLVAGEQMVGRLRDSVESAFAAGDGAGVVFYEEREGEAPAEPRSVDDCGSAGASPSQSRIEIDGRDWRRMA